MGTVPAFRHASHQSVPCNSCIFSGLGYDSICLQYWPPASAASINEHQAISVFFWIRKHEIDWPTLKALLGNSRPRVVLRVAPDPGESLDMPSAGDMSDYRIEVISGWLDKPRYLELLTSCSLFMAPRLYEGIGQSFLEAMSHGLAVIAADSPTMNEYIQHGNNGYLYSPAAPHPLDLSTLASIRKRSLRDVDEGNRNWLTQEETLLTHLSSTPRHGPDRGWLLRGMIKR